ncbi:Heat shock cognate 70 kDa protein 1 [Hordeum vulgare]|nr:Heat shock cognate 70 kDa protein 1 [Hordeum vulgare]
MRLTKFQSSSSSTLSPPLSQLGAGEEVLRCREGEDFRDHLVPAPKLLREGAADRRALRPLAAADGCCGGAFWVEVEVTPRGYVYLNRGWQAFACARGLKGRRYLHFKYDGEATLLVKILGDEGERLGCSPEDAGRSDPVDEPVSGDGRRASSSSDTPSGRSVWVAARRTPAAVIL